MTWFPQRERERERERERGRGAKDYALPLAASVVISDTSDRFKAHIFAIFDDTAAFLLGKNVTQEKCFVSKI